MNQNIIDVILYQFRRHMLLAQGIGLLLISLFVLFQVLIPLITSAYEINSTIAGKKKILVQLSDQVTFLTNLDPEVLEQRLDVLNSVLPTSKDVLLYLSTIDGLSKELSLSMNGVKLSPGEVSSGSANTTTGSGSDGAKLSSLDTDLTVMGSQESVYSFLRAIEQTAPLMRVGDARISKTDEGNVTLNLMLSMMYVVPGAQNAFTGKSVLFDDSEEKLFKQISEMKSYAFLNQEQQPLIPVGKQNLFEEVKVQP